MSVNELLLDILVVLAFAKLAAEIAERIGIPAVVGEIVAGVFVGPSLLGLVEPNPTLATLAELGVILLLLEVGMEMNLGDLRQVGRAAMGVASVGVAAPFVLGLGAALAVGLETNEAVFLGAALTATSVGITARVFGDLRALGSVEARTVLGAAVADDVMGLLILTIVTRVVTEGSIAVADVAALTAMALGFIVVATVVGMRVAPPLLQLVSRYSRGPGTLVAVALVFTLGLSELAHAAQLAPIIGAFVAGLALARTRQASRVRRELAPVGHLFVPVFFLQIGIDADIAQFAKPSALAIAGALLVAGVIGKLLSVIGMFGAPGDRWLVGIGMVPRGEVGLIFATLGLREGVIGGDVYAALLIVVLATTLLTPTALRIRHERLRVGRDDDVSELADAVAAATRAAAGAATPEDLVIVEALTPGVRSIDDRGHEALLEVVTQGSSELWRRLWIHGVLARSLPELADAIEQQHHVERLDLSDGFAWPRYGSLREAGPDCVAALLIAAIALDVSAGAVETAAPIAAATARRLRVDADRARRTVEDAELLRASARRPDGLDEAIVRGLAGHVGTAERLDDLTVLFRADRLDDLWVGERVAQLGKLISQVLVDDGADAIRSSERRRDLVAAELGDWATTATLGRLRRAPDAYLSQREPAEIAAHLRLVDVALRRDEVVAQITPIDADLYTVDVVARDRIGLLAREARALAEFRCDVRRASVVTWSPSHAMASFEVCAVAPPEPAQLARRIRELFRLPIATPALEGVVVEWDDHGSPWHSRVIIRGADQLGALASIASAFASARLNVHSASIGVSDFAVPIGALQDDRIVDQGFADVFELSDGRGRKLSASAKARVESTLRAGSTSAARGPRRLRV